MANGRFTIMCFDIDVTKFTIKELRDNLRRVEMLLSIPGVLNRLPDNGHQLRQVRDKLAKEVQFRDSLEATRKQVSKLAIKCASDTNIVNPHCAKLCSYEKKPERGRFKPHLSLKPSASGKTESMKELHSGAQLIDLPTSLSIQMDQEERVKEEQLKISHAKFYEFLKKLETEDTDSDETTPEWSFSDYVVASETDSEAESEAASEDNSQEDVEITYSIDEPGPSGLGKRKKRRKESKEEDTKIEHSANSTDLKTEAIKPEKVQSCADTLKIKMETGEPEIQSDSSEKNIQPNSNKTEVNKLEEVSDGPEEGIKSEIDNAEPKPEATELINLKTEAIKPEMNVQHCISTPKINKDTGEPENQPGSSEKKIQSSATNKTESNKPPKVSEGPEDGIQSEIDTAKPKPEAMELKKLKMEAIKPEKKLQPDSSEKKIQPSINKTEASKPIEVSEEPEERILSETGKAEAEPGAKEESLGSEDQEGFN